MARNIDHVVEMDYVDLFGESFRVRPKINMYANDNNLYVGLDYFDKEYDCWEPYCDITVNIRKLPFLESTIDTNNNGSRIVNFLIDQGFGELTSKALPSGYCVFPVFRFNPDKLKEIDPVMFDEYEKASGFKALEPLPLDDSIRQAEKSGSTGKGNADSRGVRNRMDNR